MWTAYNHYVITQATVNKFKEIIETEYKVALSEIEATEILTNLVSYFDLLAKINHRTQSKSKGR